MRTQNNILKTLKIRKQKLSNFRVCNLGLFSSYSHNEQSNKSDNDIHITTISI